MTFDEWQPRYRRLVRTYGKTESGEQCAAYFEALQQYQPDVIEHAIAKTIADEKFWPAVAVLVEHCRHVVKGEVFKRPSCEMCEGNTWVAMPGQTHNGGVFYPNYVARCPRCRASERVA